MGLEIERKFEVTGNAYKKGATKIFIQQGFLSLEKERVVRVRTAGNIAFLTIKGKSDGAKRSEFEYQIPLTEAEYLLNNLCYKPTISKTRYVTYFEGLMWEIDEFENENEGLVIAEVELIKEDFEFVKPEWLGKEVTYDERYFNANLIKNPYCKWKSNN